jgi:hypothetical protein
MAGGRPTDYKDEMIATGYEYINNHVEHGDVVPTAAGLASVLNVARRTLYDWASQESKAEFSHMLEVLNQKQERVLLSGALLNDMNANIAKLMLTKQGYSDKQQTELTGANGGPIEAQWTIQPVKPKDA